MEYQYTNRLIHETSPYLLQHAHNPVEWYPWGDEAFRKAGAEDKPILLSIGYSACHWCHVMEEESFENEEVAAVMNRLADRVPSKEEINPGEIDNAASRLLRHYDPSHGGFGTAPKFPNTTQLSLLLRYYHRTGDPLALQTVRDTLHHMAEGLTESLIDLFHDREQNGFYNTAGGAEVLFHRLKTGNDQSLPSAPLRETRGRCMTKLLSIYAGTLRALSRLRSGKI